MPMFDEYVKGLAMPEAPRWHAGALWFSDMHDGRVFRVDSSGTPQTVATVPGHPSGLGWLPDGRLLIVSMHDRKLLRLDPDGLVEAADLSNVATWHCNDMVVDAQGRAYVGNFGDASMPPQPVTPANIALVLPDGEVRVAASGLEFPNGAVITPDGRTFIVAETRAKPPRLTRFDIQEDGTLTNRRTFVEFTNEGPDGICLDAAGGVWVASAFTNEVIHVTADGVIDDRRSTGDQLAFACALGGEDGRTLFVCVANTWVEEETLRTRSGRILATRVDTPGAGLG